MKLTLKTIALCLIISIFAACNKDDDSGQFTSNSLTNNRTTLIGLWNLNEFPGDDGMVYGLNQFIPFYDTTTVLGCSIYDDQIMFLEFKYNFQNDSLGSRFFSIAEKVRSYTIVNATTCEIQYGPWSTDNYSDSETFKYEIIAPATLILNYDGTTNRDTLNYSINNNFLTLTDGESIIKLK